MDERQQLLAAIESFCEREGMAPAAFGRKAMGDGRFVGRLRDGRQVRAATLAKARQFLADYAPNDGEAAAAAGRPAGPAGDDEKGAFRFYDNRQKYLMFVNTCSEKWVVSERAGMELGLVHPRPPALRVFDAGMGDGTVLIGVMRQMHRRFPTFPFYVVGKEISVEDVRLCLEKMPDRLFEHPATVLVVTNMHYSEAPSLQPRSMQAAATLNWIETPLSGNTSHEFHEQIAALQPTLAETWRVRQSPKTGNPLYARASVLVLYREDHKFLLDPVIPRPGRASDGYDLIIASQPYRARMPAKFKVQKVLAPLSRSLAPGGRLLCIQSHGGDPGLKIVQKIWPDEQPFRTDRHVLLKALKDEIGKSRRDLRYNAYSDRRALFRYDMHTLPTEIEGSSIGTSTLFAAWNAAIYVAQIEDARLESVVADGSYLDATREVLSAHGGLWFYDESFVVSRRRA